MTTLRFTPTVATMAEHSEDNQRLECYLLGCQLLKSLLVDDNPDAGKVLKPLSEEKLEKATGDCEELIADFTRVMKIRDVHMGVDHLLNIEIHAAYQKLKGLGAEVLTESHYQSFYEVS